MMVREGLQYESNSIYFQTYIKSVDTNVTHTVRKKQVLKSSLLTIEHHITIIP